MEKETMGTVISVIKQWWLKVNRKPARVHAMDGAAFPHIIKVKYTIDGKDYICRKWIGAGNNVPDKGTTIKVTYWEDKPSTCYDVFLGNRKSCTGFQKRVKG